MVKAYPVLRDSCCWYVCCVDGWRGGEVLPGLGGGATTSPRPAPTTVLTTPQSAGQQGGTWVLHLWYLWLG